MSGREGRHHAQHLPRHPPRILGRFPAGAGADEHGGDADDPEVLDAYAEQVETTTGVLPWPPGRNDDCWCGSDLKYKKCCYLRGRA